VSTHNIKLHLYYEDQGFHHVRTLDLHDYPSGALFQRRAANRREQRNIHAITEARQDVAPR
jgi:hypothetical protein